MGSTPPPVSVPFEEWAQLVEDSRCLQALFAAGVDNWVGWDIAMDQLREEDKNE